MRKFTISIVPAFVLGLAAAAAAQGEKPITTSKEMTDTVKITVSGRVVLDYVWRSAEITAFTANVGGGSAASSDSENTFEGFLGVGMTVELSDKVSAVIEIGTKRVDGGDINEWGNQTAETIQLREAHVRLGEFLMPELTMQAGLLTWSFDLRGRGSSLVMDPRHAQSAARNAFPVADGIDPDAGGPLGANGLAGRAGSPEELEPIGVWLQYSRDLFTFDFVLLPAAIEGGPASDDEAIYAVDFFYKLDSVGKGSRIGALLALVNASGNETSVFTLGGGVDLFLMDGALEVFGEIYLQFGDAGTNLVDGDNVDAGGMAFQAGAVYNLQGDMKPWVGLTITWYSGDDDTSATDDDIDHFLSYESVGDLLILEDMYFGFDWDTNYMAFKFSGGLFLSLGAAKNNLELSAILGIARTSEDVEFVSGEDALGQEFDVRARWIITKQASLQAAVGLLFGSDVLEESMSAANDHQDDSAILYTLGADLRF